MIRFRPLLLVTSLLVLTAASLLGGSAWAVALGDRMPAADVAMKNVDSSMVSIGKLAGEKGTLVVFTCNACPYAKAWEERIAALGNKYSQQGVGVVAVNSNDPKVVPEDGFEAMQQRAKDRKLAFPYVMDETSGVAKAFGAGRTPEVFLFDGEGKLVYKGAVDDNHKEPDKVQSRYLQDALEAVVAGRDVPVKETKAMGCSIKFRS
jgi:peroxiredoxin